MASKLEVGPSKMLATRQAFLRQLGQSLNLFKCPGSSDEERGDRPMDRDPFVNLVTKDGGMELR